MNQTSSIMAQAEATRQYVPMHGFKTNAGDSLFQSGYRAVVRNECSLFVVKPDLDCYVVSPYYDTCTCKAAQTGNSCKHRREIMSLVFLTAEALEACGKGEEAKRLYEWWGVWTENRPGGAK